MIFPIAVKFKEILEGNITAGNQKAILSLIKKSIEKKSADNIVVEENTISYKDSTSPWRGALFGGLSGTFSFIEKMGSRI